MSNPEDVSEHNREHYDSVTDAWAYLLGANLHYGFFAPGVTDLAEATDQMVWEMAAFAGLGKGAGSVLDVGCGIGHPAFLLHERYGCPVTGITISRRGLEIAREQAGQRGIDEQSVRFVEADALDNGLAATSFDLLWQMESSHLIHDKIRLFQENHRVLRGGGTLVLCDLFLKRELSVVDIYNLKDELSLLEGSFGKAKMSTMPYYVDCLAQTGFDEIEVLDVTSQAKPTLAAWKQNVGIHREQIRQHLSPSAVDDFVMTCDIIENFFNQGLMGYGMIRAVRPGLA